MSKDRENAIKVLSHLSPSIREAIAVYIETAFMRLSGPVDHLATEIREMGK